MKEVFITHAKRDQIFTRRSRYYTLFIWNKVICLSHITHKNKRLKQWYFFFLNKYRNLDWELGDSYPGLKLKDLILGIYEKASMRKMWWLVRHSAGMLSMKADELAKVNNLILFKRIDFNFYLNWNFIKGCLVTNC